mmetsp:Transcript_17907/g.30456  ORF Transcript_17907/g.30456 Transcript_17907/m.30456 type:complete len:106 (+) Transcript_17907:891-1208(+)
MEQFAISIKLRYKDDGHLGHRLYIPKGVEIPPCLRSKERNALSEFQALQLRVKERAKLSKCDNCGKDSTGGEEQRGSGKYRCATSGKVGCSLECYKSNLARFRNA